MGDVKKGRKSREVRARAERRSEGKLEERGVDVKRRNDRRMCVCKLMWMCLKKGEREGVGSFFGLFFLAHLPGEAAANRKV